jgi:hypothetical protein
MGTGAALEAIPQFNLPEMCDASSKQTRAAQTIAAA